MNEDMNKCIDCESCVDGKCMFCNGTEIVDVNEEFFCIYFSLSEHRKKPKDTILDKLESAFADMNAHSYNDYADDSECVIRLNVKELNWLYEQIR